MAVQIFSAPPAARQLYRAEEVRELDRQAIEEHGIPGYTLMNRAGAAAFSVLRERWPSARRIAVLCGGGNNGGDGYVVARLARQTGLEPRVLYLKEPEQLKGDARTAYIDAREIGAPIQPFDAALLNDAEVIVDALLGTGLERNVEGAYREAVAAINASSAGILAIDIPSGLNADRGAIMGIAVRAHATVSFIGLKQGLFTGQGPACSGTVVFNDLGVPSAIYAAVEAPSQVYAGEDLTQLLAPRSRAAHKGDFGHVLVIGGDHGMAGAARMAAEAAARCGAGLTSVATRAEHAGFAAATRPELMFRGVETAKELDPLLERATVIAVGPGLGRGDWGRSLFERALQTDLPLVVDADALNLLSAAPAARGDWVLTPHPGEAGRLLADSAKTVQNDRFAAVTELVKRFAGVCVLKGAGSLIAAKDKPVSVCTAGNPGMASGGMGDVLTGVIAALLAQGLSYFEAARAGVHIHGRAADLAADAGQRGLLAMDLMPHLRALVNPGNP